MPEKLIQIELTEMTCWCGIRHAVPGELAREQRRAHDSGRQVPSIYCPLGHTHFPAGEPRYKELERKLAQEIAAHDQTRAELETQQRTSARLQRRVAAGVCPCCKRSFQNLARHMRSKHPRFGKGSR